jgi:hypothetical protein
MFRPFLYRYGIGIIVNHVWIVRFGRFFGWWPFLHFEHWKFDVCHIERARS